MYYIFEIQQYQDGSFGHLVHWGETRNQAESKYHEVLAAAAVSGLPKHSATLLSEEGFPLDNKVYRHEVQPTPEPQPESDPENSTEPEQTE